MKTVSSAFAVLLASSLPAQRPPARTDHTQPALAIPSSLPSAVVFDRPAAAGPLWALGHAWKASFDGQGCTIVPFFGTDAPRNYPLRLELANVTVGGEPLALADGEPAAAAGSVRTARGALVEIVDTRLQELEQSFVFATLPNRGALVVELAITTELACTPGADGLSFANERGSVAYRKAVAVDANGASLPLPIEWTGTRARMTIPAAFVAAARLPLVLDPLLAFSPGYSPFQTMEQRDPDVATIQSPHRSCVVWRRQWSVVDQDCYATVIDQALLQTTTLLVVDFTTTSWSTPVVASSNFAQSFMVASQVDSGSTSWIAGRLIQANGTMNTQFDIERGGVVGLPGNNYRPDIGGDPYPGVVAFYTVVFEHESAPGNRDIYCKQLEQNGTLRTLNPILIDASPANESWPSISKSNWQGSWFLVWQHTWSPTDEDLRGAQLGFSGSLLVGPYFVAGSSLNERQPSVSSPAFIDGSRYALAVWQTETNGDNDITCRVIDSTGGLWAYTNLSQVEAGGVYQAWNEVQPDVDSDGLRFAVASAEQYGGFTYDTNVTTVAFLPASNTLRLDEEHVVLGSSPYDELRPRICADFSGGPAASPRYLVVGANHGANDTEVFAYGGYQPGPLFTTRALQCGTLSIAATGTPAAGNTVAFTVGNGPLSGTILGFPGTIPLNALGCNCVQGVVNGLYFGNPFTWTIPPNATYVGITLSVQGFTIVGNQCLGFVDLSDTIDFTIR